MDNHFTRLRQARLAQSSRPFRARGISVVRCPRCLLAQTGCICRWRKPQQADLDFCLLMHDSEPLKPSNTGRLIADILPSTRAFMWRRTEADPQLLALLQDPGYAPVVVFPDSFACPDRVIYQVSLSSPSCGVGNANNGLPVATTTSILPRPLLILLDGTWSQARKMFRKSPYLDALPVLSLAPAESEYKPYTSDYGLRKRETEGQLCTAEVAFHLLAQHQQFPAAQVLADYFEIFNLHYQALRRTTRAAMDTPAHQRLAAL